MFRTVVDIENGTVSEVLLTQVEIAEIAARPPTPTPPVVCSPWQIRKVLNQLGLRQDIESAVLSSPDQAIKDGWEFATEFRSDDTFVLSIGASVGKTPEEVFSLIQLASTL